MRITMLTVGTLGDVQPFVALGLGLRRAGHTVRLATHAVFQEFVLQNGLDFAPIAGDPQAFLRGELGQAWQEGDPNFFRLMRADPTFPQGMGRGLNDCWHACQDAEAIVYAPPALAGPHIAEKLGVPGFAAAIYPSVRRTRAFSHPLAPPRPRLGCAYNWLTYVVVDRVGWHCFGEVVNQFRCETLHLPPLRFWTEPQNGPDQANVPLLYGYSPAVLPRPADWSARDYVTGYWFLERAADWQPPPELEVFLETGAPPVYIGFGSMVIRDPAALTRLVLAAISRSGQRAILGMGWGGLSKIDLPGEVFKVEAVPHDWLFPRVAAAVHHGGCGTTAASLRAGIPTAVMPFCADQPFWGQRVAELGVGPPPIPPKRLTVERLANTIRTITGDAAMRTRAAALGEQIRAEDGIARAVELIQRHLLRCSSTRPFPSWAAGRQQELSG